MGACICEYGFLVAGLKSEDKGSLGKETMRHQALDFCYLNSPKSLFSAKYTEPFLSLLFTLSLSIHTYISVIDTASPQLIPPYCSS